MSEYRVSGMYYVFFPFNFVSTWQTLTCNFLWLWSGMVLVIYFHCCNNNGPKIEGITSVFMVIKKTLNSIKVYEVSCSDFFMSVLENLCVSCFFHRYFLSGWAVAPCLSQATWDLQSASAWLHSQLVETEKTIEGDSTFSPQTGLSGSEVYHLYLFVDIKETCRNAT